MITAAIIRTRKRQYLGFVALNADAKGLKSRMSEIKNQVTGSDKGFVRTVERVFELMNIFSLYITNM